jgi:hypothetical protein
MCQKPSVNILFIKHKLVCLHQVDHLFIDSLGLIGFSRIRTVQSKLTCRLKHVKKKSNSSWIVSHIFVYCSDRFLPIDDRSNCFRQAQINI